MYVKVFGGVDSRTDEKIWWKDEGDSATGACRGSGS